MKKRKKKRHNIILYLFVWFILFLSLIAVIYSDLNQIMINKEETKRLEKKYELLKEEEASLNVEVSKLQDPDYIARYAREKYMFSKDGEIILRMVDPVETKENNTEEEE